MSGSGPPVSRRVLYITYDGLLEPLGASQVMPYLRGLDRAGVELDVLSFEKPDDLADGARRTQLEGELRDRGIGWLRRRYHQRPTLPATAWDVHQGRRAVRRWARSDGASGLVHARGYLPGFMGEAVKEAGGRLLFDMRGFWVDERIEGGYWATGSLQARVGRAVERRVLAAADHLILLTRKGVERVTEFAGYQGAPSTVIPTCVELGRFPLPEDRDSARRSLGLGRAPVLIHSGTLTGWYDGPATMAVARAFVRRTGGSFVVLTRDVDAARRMAREAGVEARIESASPEAVASWLQAADVGLALVRPSPSKDASYPTKIGEYLASGLAVLTTPIGDLAELADPRLVRLWAEGEDPESAAAWLARVASDPHRARDARRLAAAELSVEQGVERLVESYRSLGVGPGMRA